MPSRDPSLASLVHPDVAEPLAVQDLGHLTGRPFRHARPPQHWKSKNYQRIELDGFDLTHLQGGNFELEFETKSHLIDFNFAPSPSIMRVNGGGEEHWAFAPYTISFAPKGTRLYRNPLRSDDTRLIGLSFSSQYLDILTADLLDGRPLSFVEMSQPARWPSLDRLQSGLLALFRAPHLYSRLTAEALASDAITRGLMRWSSAGGVSQTLRYKTDDEVVGRAVDFIAAHLKTSISLADIAKAAGRDATLLVHAFKIAIGVTPYAFLIANRIDAAKNDLRTSELDIAAISRRYCFGSPAHFSTTFRKEVGVSPSAYRRAVAS